MEDSLLRAAELSLAGVLIVAGLAKQRVDARRATSLALADLARGVNNTISLTSVARAWRGVGAIELVTGAALVVPSFSDIAAVAAAGLLTAGLAYLVVAQKFAPGSACGCFGTGGRITGRTVLRCVYLLGWAGFAAIRAATRTPGAHTSTPAVVALAALIVVPVIVTSLAWQELSSAARARCSQLAMFVRARVASPEVALSEARKSEVWNAMLREIGLSMPELATVDTWLEGDWRIWELSEAGMPNGVHLIVGVYLGTRSRLTRLMLYEGPVENGNYVGTWDSRLIGLETLEAPAVSVSRPVEASRSVAHAK